MTSTILIGGYLTLDVVCRLGVLPDWDMRVTASTIGHEAGGMAANMACAAVRAGADARLFARTSDDGVGDRLVADIERHGVDVSGVRQEPGGLSTCVILVDESGRRSIVSEPLAFDWRGIDAALDDAALPPGTVLHVDGYQLDETLSRAPRIRERGVRASIDLDGLDKLDPDQAGAIAAAFDIICANAAIASMLAAQPEDAARHLGAGGARVAITLGSDGAVVVGPDTGPEAIPAPDVHVVDTTGAGDVFAGNFVSGLAAGASTVRAASLACAAASLATTAWGARGCVPTREEAAAALASAEAATVNYDRDPDPQKG